MRLFSVATSGDRASALELLPCLWQFGRDRNALNRETASGWLRKGLFHMAKSEIGAIILAAGMGTRMKSARHKVLHAIGGRAMIRHLLDSLNRLGASKQVLVVGALKEQLEEALPDAEFAIQDPPLGTGHAVLAARDALAGFAGDILILYGDVPMVRAETMSRMIAALHERDDTALVVLGFTPRDPAQYGRLVVAKNKSADGALEAIVEFREATADQRRIRLCNSGIMAVKGALLFDLLEKVDNQNAKGEYYLTDIVAIARGQGRGAVAVEASEEEVMGINSRAELAEAEAIFQAERRTEAMEAGVTLLDPATVYFSHDTVLGKDVTIGPSVFFGPGVTIHDRVMIHAFSHLEGAEVGEGASVGPFARLRPGAHIKAGAKVGNFVEIKKAVIEEGAKVNHLAYIGDARIGKGANIGAGTITCNYDGFNKHFTDIGEGAFIGSNTALVAPVTIGDGAIVGAGSVVTKDVAANALAVTRAAHTEKEGWAEKFRHRNAKDEES